MGRRANDKPRTHVLRDLHTEDTNTRASPLNQNSIFPFHPSGGDNGIVHSLQGHWQGRCLFKAHVVAWHLPGASGMGYRILGISPVSRAHHPIPDRQIRHTIAKACHFTRPFATTDAAGSETTGALQR